MNKESLPEISVFISLPHRFFASYHVMCCSIIFLCMWYMRLQAKQTDHELKMYRGQQTQRAKCCFRRCPRFPGRLWFPVGIFMEKKEDLVEGIQPHLKDKWVRWNHETLRVGYCLTFQHVLTLRQTKIPEYCIAQLSHSKDEETVKISKLSTLQFD